MGRPIKKTFFGNLNSPSAGSVVLGSGVGGEGFTDVHVKNAGANDLYTTATTVTWVGSTPQTPGGAIASGTATVSVQGRVTALNISAAGSGYTSTSSVTVTLSPATTGTAATYAVRLTTTVPDSIAAFARVEGTTAIGLCDIIKQEASRRYLVQTSTGTSQCRLVASDTPASKEMYIIATDTQACTYWVTKLTARRAYLTQRTSAGSGYQFVDGTSAGWNITGAVTGFVSIAHTN